MCLYPTTYRIKGLPHSFDNLVRAKCNHCIECKMQHLSGIKLRIALQLKWPKYPSQTWDLTYTDAELPENQLPDFAPVRAMIKRVRQHLWRRGYGTEFKYYAVSEWAPDTNRLHWHLIVFDFPYRPTLKEQKAFWPHGRSMMRLVKGSKNTTNYVTKYIMKSLYTETYHKPKVSYSTRPVLGTRTMTKICEDNINQGYFPERILPLFQMRHTDDPFEEFSIYSCPDYFMDLQRKIYGAAGHKYPEKSAITSELITIGKLQAPDPEEVLYREKARKKRDERFEELRLRDKFKTPMSINKYVQLENEQVQNTPEPPLKRKKKMPHD